MTGSSQNLVPTLQLLSDLFGPWRARKIAPGKECLDEVLRPVGRASIADDPASDVVSDCRQAALEICHLVLNDHVEAKALVFYHRQTF